MSARSLKTLTLVFSDPAWTIGTTDVEFATLNASVAAPPITTSNIQTLSTSASTPGQDTVGLLYTPDLSSEEPCSVASRPYVPANVTRQGSLPNENYNLIALAPWISAECTLAYLKAAQSDPCNGFLFFLPDDRSTIPEPNDQFWDLGDGGAYKSMNKYPIYVIDGDVGRSLMLQSAQYSGNMTGVPHGHELAAAYDPRDYVRLYVNITLASSNSLPSLWVFLLIVLGILLAIIAATIISILCLARKRRHKLRRRIINGEVDLEASGIQRLIVPQNLLDLMPVYEYGTEKPTDQQLFSEKEELDHPTPDRATTQHLAQSKCPICLDDFTSGTLEHSGCTVRELPCKHIFHPECVDSFLRENSSLCPMCKTSALPRGYCPKVITNAMVRRERMVRRRRERMIYEESGPYLHHRNDLSTTWTGPAVSERLLPAADDDVAPVPGANVPSKIVHIDQQSTALGQRAHTGIAGGSLPSR